jgi:pSer/pThr/pTyr-binding forkhead associated (FHA) protein
MTKHGIEDTIHFNSDDLDFIKNDKIDVEKGLIYSGRGQGSFVVFVTGPDKGNVIAINKEKMVIGRDKNADIFIDKKFVSKKHAKIVTIGDKTVITDFGSKNGTFLNETPVKKALLKDQDEIRIGDIIIKYFRIDLDDGSLSQVLPSDGDKTYTVFYNQVFNELKPFFGPMTDRFLTRQITAHVGKTPYTLSVSDKPVLAKWVKISAGLLLNEETAAKLADKILALK